VLATFDKFAYEKSMLINVGDEKGLLLDAAVRRANPALALELGTYCGYGALRIARAALNAKVYSVELAEANAANARQIWAHAGVADRVTCVVGTIGDGERTLDRLANQHGFTSGDKLTAGNPKSAAGRRSVPIPERVMPILSERISGRFPGEPAVTSPNGSLLGLENWKRSTRWRNAIVEIGRPSLRVHDLRHTYASLARRAGADLRLLQKTMGHASITVTAHVYADLYDDELDDIASALDALDDARGDLP
jgi:hypothetical protein